MQTVENYKDALNKPRIIRIGGRELTSPREHPQLRLGVAANERFYEYGHSKSFQNIRLLNNENKKQAKHPFFDICKNYQDIAYCGNLIDSMQKQFHGLFTRSPDYKGAFVTCFKTNAAHFGEFEKNALKWQDLIATKLPVLTHAFVAPSSWGSTDLQLDRGLKIVSRDSSGITVRGLKAVSTGATAAQYVYVRDSIKTEKTIQGLSFIIDISTPGLKLICSPGLDPNDDTVAGISDPISNFIAENDTMLLFDDVFVPYKNILCAEELDPSRWARQHYGFVERARFHGVIRCINKLKTILGFLVVATPRMKPGGVQTKEIIAKVELALQILGALKEKMVNHPTKNDNNEYIPNTSASAAAYVIAPNLFSDIRASLTKNFAGQLISIPDHSTGLTDDELENLWGENASRETFDMSVGYIRGLKELVLGNFGLRQELFEANYLGNTDYALMDLFKYVKTSPETVETIRRSQEIFSNPLISNN